MLNGDFATQQAKALAARLLKEAGVNPKRQIDLAYRLTTGRAPNQKELQIALAFLREKKSMDAEKAREQFALAMFNLNAFLYMN